MTSDGNASREAQPGRDTTQHSAVARAVEAAARAPLMVEAIRHLTAGETRAAESAVRRQLAIQPDNVAALCLLADIAQRVGVFVDAERLLRRACELAPEFVEARINHAKVLFQQNRTVEALTDLEIILIENPRNLQARLARIRIRAQTGDYLEALGDFETAFAQGEGSASLRVGYANVLKTVGRSSEAIASYRRALSENPALAESWWALSNMHPPQLDAVDTAAIATALVTAGSDRNRVFLHFALGKAHEGRKEFSSAFRHYAEGNKLRRHNTPHDRVALTREVDRSIALFTPAFFAERASWGSNATDPIFIVGMPRAGSTLIEQILASHPMVEGTSELPDIPMLVNHILAVRWRDSPVSFPDVLLQLPPPDVAQLANNYLDATAQHRKTDKPFFIDKLPNNWMYVGLIKLIFPRARIVDARRNAMACCFANFKQHFERGQDFAYDLVDLGHYYRDYVRLMRHFDVVDPNLVYKVQHEDLTLCPEHQIRSLLDRLGLPFDQACLRPHKNPRPVRTASSEQVRRPINRDAIDLWKSYEPWLAPLKAALGDA